MAESDRGIHPDLLEEVVAERESAEAAPVETPQRTRSRPSRHAPASDSTPAPSDSEPGQTESQPSEPQAAAEAPEWFGQVREAKDSTEALRAILKNVPYDELEKDEVFSGLVGRVSDRRLRQQQAAEFERQKLEAAQNNDLYTLGELEQRRLQQEQAIAQQAAQAASGGFMDGVVLFQQKLDRSIQEKVAGQTFGAGKGQAEGVAEYLQFVHDESVKLDVERERRDIESALRKSVLSEVRGDEPVPERESGTPGRVREVTDEQIEAMTMQEYEALFDEHGRPKSGVRHRATRSIPLTQR